MVTEFDTGDEDNVRKCFTTHRRAPGPAPSIILHLGTVIAPTAAIALVLVAPRLVRRRLFNPSLFVPPDFDVALSLRNTPHHYLLIGSVCLL